MISRLLLTARTAVHLRPVQVAGRLRRTTRQWIGPPRVRTPPRAPELAPGLVRLTGAVVARSRGPDLASLRRRAAQLRDGVFHAVGASLPVGDIEWTRHQRSHLFTYHLHYFDEAPVLAAMARGGDRDALARLESLWQSWLEVTREGQGNGWDPYPLASRMPNWIQGLAIVAPRDGPSLIPDDLRARLLSSLWSQADRLRRTLEHDLQGNHLLRSRTALVWAAASLDPPPLDLDDAVVELVREVDRQVLPDGMHEERTPAYHAKALHDVLGTIELLRTLECVVPDTLVARARDMSEAMRRFVRADGGLHPFGDTTPHGHPPPAAVKRLAREVLGSSAPTSDTTGPWHLDTAGFVGVRNDDLDLVLDCGPFGAHHQPGHGHCDGLSFVVSVRGTPFVVDPGIAGYGDDPLRHWARGTAAHNTVQIDGREQTEIWGTFRAARRAIPGPAGTGSDGDEVRLFGAVSPYHATGVRHERELVIRADELEVRDRMSGARGHRLDTRLHLAPEATVRPTGDATWSVTCRGEEIHLSIDGVDEARWEAAPVFPGWGRVTEGPVLHGWIDRAQSNVERFGFHIRLGP